MCVYVCMCMCGGCGGGRLAGCASQGQQWRVREFDGRLTRSLGQVMDWIGKIGEGQKTLLSSMGAGRDGVNGLVRRWVDGLNAERRVEIGFVRTKQEKKTKRPYSLCY